MVTRTLDRPETQPEINEFRRTKLMEATIKLLAAKGVPGATVRAITAEAGVSHGLIGHYYATKDDLLVAALQHLFGGVAQTVAAFVEGAGPDARDRLMALPRVLFSENVFTETNASAFLAFWHEIRFNEAVWQANQTLYDGYRSRVHSLFEAAAGQAGITLDCYSATKGMIALSDGLWLELSIGAGAASTQSAIDLCQGYIERQLIS